jgi:hypothetical protein
MHGLRFFSWSQHLHGLAGIGGFGSDKLMARKSIAQLAGRSKSKPAWIACGVDISMSSIAVAAIGYDATLKKLRGPSLHTLRWQSEHDYLDRLKQAARAENLIQDAVSGLKFFVSSADDIFIAVEEPWPMGLVKRAQSAYIKQQAQMSGAFLGGLMRYGYSNVFEINYQTWLNVVRAELDETIPNNKEAKWKVKRWAIEAFGVPDFPDLIQSKHGKIPRPEKSVAKAVQPEDIYDALGIMEWMRVEAEEQLS